jgi:hypothetical protein
MKTFINGNDEVEVEHGMGGGNELYGIFDKSFLKYNNPVTCCRFIVMANSEEDAVKKFNANRKAVEKARGDYNPAFRNGTTPMHHIENPCAIKLPTNRCIPVSYFDDSRSV